VQPRLAGVNDDVFTSTVIARLLFCSPRGLDSALLQTVRGWTAFYAVADDSYCSSDTPTVTAMFGRILANNGRTATYYNSIGYLPERPHSQYTTRVQEHNKTLTANTTHLNGKDFLISVQVTVTVTELHSSTNCSQKNHAVL